MGYMKSKFTSLIILLLFGLCNSYGQDQILWKDFVNNAEKYYYKIDESNINNFSATITSATYLNYLKSNEYDSSYTYPLKFIWTNQGKVYYVLQPYPNMSDEIKRKEDLVEIQAIKNQFKSFLVDWQNFMFYSPFGDIPQDPTVHLANDTVQVTYFSGEGDMQVTVKKLFLSSGKLTKVTVQSSNQSVMVTPVYVEKEGKWLCAGWDSQIYQASEITSGTAIRLELYKTPNYWMPSRVNMLIQTVEKPEEKYLITLYLKDYIYNIALEEISQQQSSKVEPTAKKN
jgi:hypothetical protein